MSSKLELELPQQETDKTGAIAPLIFLSVALVAVSLAAILIKLSEREIGPNATIFNRLWIATIAFSLWNGLKAVVDRKEENITVKSLPDSYQQGLLFILVGIVGSASVICWAWSLTQTSVANSTVLRSMSPVFTSLGGWLLFNQRFDRRFLAGMVLAIFGAIALEWDDLQIDSDRLIGDLVALLSAFFYAANLLIIESLRSNFTAATILLWRCGIGSLFLLPIVWLTEEQFFPKTIEGWLIIIALAVICQTFGQGLLVHTLNRFSSGFVAVVLLFEPAIAAFFAWLIFAEQLTLVNGLAFAVVLAGIYLAKTSGYADKVEDE